MESILEWSAAIGAMVAAGAIAADLGRRATGWAFVLFSVVSLVWIAAGFVSDTMALVAQNAVLLLINLWGVWQYLIRKKSPDA
ncbi:MAG: hypothetical protein ABJM58_04840 [Alteripontixanthobacter sp.]